MTDKTGEPVFPTIHNGSTLPGERGMTLRDWFAGMAMQADVSRVGYYQTDEHMLRAAKTAYAMADAMLKAQTVTES